MQGIYAVLRALPGSHRIAIIWLAPCSDKPQIHIRLAYPGSWSSNAAGDYLNANAQFSIFGSGLIAVLGTESLVHRPAASLSHCQVLPSVAGTEGMEGCSAVAGAASYDCSLAASATYYAWHSHPVSTDAVQALIGVAEVPRNHVQIRLPQSVYLHVHALALWLHALASLLVEIPARYGQP